jgi:hypothetical protein
MNTSSLRPQQRDGGDITRRHALKKLKRSLPSNVNAAHVADIEQTGGLPDMSVFLHHARILNRHLPAGEIYEFGPMDTMLFYQGSLFHDLCHNEVTPPAAQPQK